MAAPQGPAAAGGDRLWAGHADREQVIGALMAAFAQGLLAKSLSGNLRRRAAGLAVSGGRGACSW